MDIVLEAPVLGDVASWDCCMISSTSRLLLPVDRLRICREGERWSAMDADCEHSFDGSLARKLADAVAAKVEDSSTSISQ